MSIFIDSQSLSLAKDVTHAACITLYGLHYNVNWRVLRNKQLIIKALKINDAVDNLSDSEVQCLSDKLVSLTGSCTSCTTGSYYYNRH